MPDTRAVIEMIVDEVMVDNAGVFLSKCGWRKMSVFSNSHVLLG